MIKSNIKSVVYSILHSYSQIFFSDGKLLGLILLVVSFFNLNAGLSGVIAIAASHITAYLLGLNRTKIINGLYGFNSLLVGLGLGIYYQFNWQFLLLVIFSSILTLFVTVVLEAILNKYALPFLSLPFLFGIWLVSLAARHYGSLELSEIGVYSYNDMVLLGGNDLLQSHFIFKNFSLPESLSLYFVSLGAIFFQYNVYAGIIIAIALLINSRISFLLSLVGFYSAYFYYQFIGASLGELNYGYIGFNFILTAIAIGGYFIIPSVYSFITIVLLIPLLSILVSGTTDVLSIFQLSTYSLPVNVVVISFLLVLKYRERFFRRPELVSLQKFSPEKNLYSNHNYYSRFGDRAIIPIHFPFFGKWIVNQAHDGKYTHQNEWKHAWDFVIEEKGLEYDGEGNKPEDYYCYNKPIVAAADGEVVEIVDLFDDNKIGDVDLKHNWGNSIVIKHAQYLYSQVSHIKKGSFRVVKGQYVKKGEVLATVGNSGRSPFPHLHFQLQATPFVGSKTLKYPVGPFISEDKSGFNFVANGIPKLNQQVSNIEIDGSLKSAFKFIPGMEIEWELTSTNTDKKFSKEQLKWIVGVDFYNQTYIYSSYSNSYAYFRVNEEELIFTSYTGSKSDPLYWFYLTAYRMIFGYYKGVEVKDFLPATISKARVLKFVQDFVAPFYIFIKPVFKMQYLSRKQFFDDSELEIKSEYSDVVMNKTIGKISADFKYSSNDFIWIIKEGNNEFEFKKL
jgi:urea transporter